MNTTYERYLRTPTWFAKRKAALARDNWKCLTCGARNKLEVHHKRYPRVLGTEPITWLETLCSECHTKKHSKKPRVVGEEVRGGKTFVVVKYQDGRMPRAKGYGKRKTRVNQGVPRKRKKKRNR